MTKTLQSVEDGLKEFLQHPNYKKRACGMNIAIYENLYLKGFGWHFCHKTGEHAYKVGEVKPHIHRQDGMFKVVKVIEV